MGKFNQQQWVDIFQKLGVNESHYGLPERRKDSLVFTSFNIRKFGKYKSSNSIKRSAGSWDLLTRYCERYFDFVRLFLDAVPAAIKPNGKPDYNSLFEYDVSDHMPIWIRLQRPTANQRRFRWR